MSSRSRGWGCCGCFGGRAASEEGEVVLTPRGRGTRRVSDVHMLSGGGGGDGDARSGASGGVGVGDGSVSGAGPPGDSVQGKGKSKYEVDAQDPDQSAEVFERDMGSRTNSLKEIYKNAGSKPDDAGGAGHSGEGGASREVSRRPSRKASVGVGGGATTTVAALRDQKVSLQPGGPGAGPLRFRTSSFKKPQPGSHSRIPSNASIRASPRGISEVPSSRFLQYAQSRTEGGVMSSRFGTDVSASEDLQDTGEVSFPRGMSREYGFIWQDVPGREFDASREELNWGSYDRYEIFEDKLLGHGAYGQVYLAQDKASNEVCVAKTIKPQKEKLIKIKKEIMMLRRVQGGPYIVKLLDLIADPMSNNKMIMFEFLNNPNYKDSFRLMSDMDARWYLYRVLQALDYSHSLGIIHRDIKGGNILYDPRTKQVRLIDWGFAEFYRPNVPLKSWPGTRPYKAPELFLHYPYYDYSVDVWAFACLMGSLIFRRTVFRSKDNRHQMELMARSLGTASYERYLRKYSRPPYKMQAKKYRNLGEPRMGRAGWMGFVSSRTPLATPEALSVIDSIFVWDHEKRPMAKEVMQHPYFDPVRHGVGGEDSPIVVSPRSPPSACSGGEGRDTGGGGGGGDDVATTTTAAAQ